MEYVNEGILDIEYNEKADKNKWTSYIRNHKVMSFVIILTTVLIIANCCMIYSFFKIMSTL